MNRLFLIAGLALGLAGSMVSGACAEEIDPLNLPSDGVAFWNAAMESYENGNYLDALQKLKWYQRQVEGGEEAWHPHLVSFLRIRCAVNLGHFEKVLGKIDALDVDQLPAPLRHQARVLQWQRRLSAENSSANTGNPADERVAAPMADAQLASVMGRVQESDGDSESALQSYARAIVLASPEDDEETGYAMKRMIEILTVSGRGKEAVRLMQVQTTLQGKNQHPSDP